MALRGTAMPRSETPFPQNAADHANSGDAMNSFAVPAATPSRTRAGRALALLTILLAFACAIAWHIGLPGLYMDAVNPDYTVVDVLRGMSPDAPIWGLPGNILFNRIPLLTSMYHGTLNVWLALPFVALFGPGTIVLRIAQATAGAAILVLMFVLLRERHSRARWPWLAWLAVLALALDPAFVYSFRTQIYIQLCPVALLLGAVIAGARAFRLDPEPATARRGFWLLLAGFCYGLSLFGYFIFSFFAPVMFAALVIAARRTRTPVLRAGAWAALGFALGVSGFVFGYLGIAHAQGGMRGFLEFFSRYQQSLGAFVAHRPFSHVPGYFAELIELVFSNTWQYALMFGPEIPQPGYLLKLSLLLALPFVLWIVCEIRGHRSWLLRLVLALIVCYPIVGLIFGDRLSGHHFIVLLPLTYLALAAGWIALARDERLRTLAKPAAALVLLTLIGIDIAGLRYTDAELVRSHGRKLFSDAIDRFAADANALPEPNNQYYLMPDWGLYMPFHFLTGAKIPHGSALDMQELRNRLCQGKHITVALITGDIPARIGELTQNLKAAEPTQHIYRDHEGTPVFTAATFDRYASDNTRAENCAAPAPPLPAGS
jgi:hypothetical protein